MPYHHAEIENRRNRETIELVATDSLMEASPAGRGLVVHARASVDSPSGVGPLPTETATVSRGFYAETLGSEFELPGRRGRLPRFRTRSPGIFWPANVRGKRDNLIL